MTLVMDAGTLREGTLGLLSTGGYPDCIRAILQMPWSGQRRLVKGHLRAERAGAPGRW